jgi:hypothetical protein
MGVRYRVLPNDVHTTPAKKWELGFVLTVRKRVDTFFFAWGPRSIFETQQDGELRKKYLWLKVC